MLRGFLQNTAISAVAYAVAGVLGLFAIGIIARSYGVGVLGLIVLTRSFLPAGFFALIDLGVSEIDDSICRAGPRRRLGRRERKSVAADSDCNRHRNRFRDPALGRCCAPCEDFQGGA